MTLKKLEEKIKKEMDRIEKEYDVDKWTGLDAKRLTDPVEAFKMGVYRAFQITIGFISISPLVELENPD